MANLDKQPPLAQPSDGQCSPTIVSELVKRRGRSETSERVAICEELYSGFDSKTKKMIPKASAKSKGAKADSLRPKQLKKRLTPALREPVKVEAHEDAELVAKTIIPYYKQFRSLDMAPLDVGGYLDAEAELMLELYRLVGKHQPSPLAVRELLFRLALDPRVPLARPVREMSLSRDERGFYIDGSREEILLRCLPRDRRIVIVPPATVLLSHFDRAEPAYFLMREYIESVLPPGVATDDLPASERLVEFRTEGMRHIELWLNGKSLPSLGNRKDVLKLLVLLCNRPDRRRSGTDLKKNQTTSNPSRTVACVNKLFQKFCDNSAVWITGSPHGWAPGIRVKKRQEPD